MRERVERLAAHAPDGRKDLEPGIRILPPTRYPYRIYYAVEADAVVILHVRHSARRDPDFRNLRDR